MHAAHDVTIPGPAFADALRRILPRGTKRDPGNVILWPLADGAMVLEGFYASASVPAEGAWADPVHAPGVFLRNFSRGTQPAAVRLVFFDRVLSINGTSVTARAAPGGAMPSQPYNQPTNRLGAPLAKGAHPPQRRR
jgi:hypothetical protein